MQEKITTVGGILRSSVGKHIRSCMLGPSRSGKQSSWLESRPKVGWHKRHKVDGHIRPWRGLAARCIERTLEAGERCKRSWSLAHERYRRRFLRMARSRWTSRLRGSRLAQLELLQGRFLVSFNFFLKNFEELLKNF